MKRLVGVAVTALLSVSVCFTAFGAVSTNASPWAVPHMEQAYSLQLITAPLLQQAQDTMTRVEFSEIAVAFYEKVTGTTAPMPKENPFSDCDEPAALKAYGLGIIAGVEPGTFAPENPLTREQMAIMLVRTLEKVGVDMSLYAKKNPFTDAKNISATTVSYIDKAYGAGLISGYQNGTFAPKNTLKVQEAVTAFLSAYTFYEGVQNGTSVPKGDALMAKTVAINGKELTLGQTIEEVQATFGAPTRIDETVYGLDRYIYAGDGYFWVTFENDAAVEFFIPSSKFQYQGIQGGTVLNDASHVDSISNVDHCAVLNGEYASARIPLDYENQICGLLLQTKEFASKDALTGSLSGAQKTDIEKELLEIINIQRQEAGLAALTENEGLDQTASAHSTEMVKEKYFDYKSKDGKTPFQRMMENNVQFHTASEVIATTRGDVVQLYTELLRTAAKHNSIMDSTMTQAGIGVANDGKVLYLTIDLCNG